MLAGGMGAWAGVPHAAQVGRRPDDDVHHAALRRAAAGRASPRRFMTFIATVLFFAIAGPLAMFFGAGRSLGQRGQRPRPLALRPVPGQPERSSRCSACCMVVVIFFPALVRDLIHRLAEWVGRRSHAGGGAAGAAARPASTQAHASVIAFNTPARLAGALLGHAPLGPVPRQQAARRLRRAARARHPRELRRHPAGADPDHVPALLRPDARRLGHRRGALGAR